MRSKRKQISCGGCLVGFLRTVLYTQILICGEKSVLGVKKKKLLYTRSFTVPKILFLITTNYVITFNTFTNTNIFLLHFTFTNRHSCTIASIVDRVLLVQEASDDMVGDVTFNVTFCDSKCDQSFGPKCLMDSILSRTDVVFGPSCDYSLGRKEDMSNIYIFKKYIHSR